MKVSDLVLKTLAEQGIDTAFTVYGGAISELMDAFVRQDKIKYVCTQHEQAAGFAAEGYAKTKGIPGLAIATSGPGGGNLVTAIQDCYYDSTPCIFITGQVSTKFIRPDDSIRQVGFQETPIVDIVRPITKYAVCVTDPYHLLTALTFAISACKSGRPGPVLIDLPIDVQRAECAVFSCSEPTGRYSPQTQMDAYLADLRNAKRPAILVGGGARKAARSIALFAKQHSIPCFRTWNALDVITDDLPIYCGTIGTYGGPGRNFGIQNCDLLLALGCRFSGRITGGMPETFARGAKKYVVDFEPLAGDVNITSSCEDFMFCTRPIDVHFGDWLEQCRGWLYKYDPVKPEMFGEDVHHYAFIRKLSQKLPSNAIIVSDTGGNVIMMGHAFQSKEGQRIFTSNGNTPMGFALCGAIGAWFADRTRPIVCLIGDGGMQLNIQELQTLVHYGINIKVFIINNHILGNTKSFQRVNGMQEVGCGPDGYSCPDFTKIVSAYGLHAFHIPSSKYFDPIYKAVMETEEPVICDVPQHDFCTYEPRISRFDLPIEDMYPFLPRDEFRKNMIVEPLAGWECIKD